MLRVALPPVRRVIGRVAARAAKARPRAPPCPGRRRDRPPSPSTDPATARHSGGRARRDRAVPPWGPIIEGFTTETQRTRRGECFFAVFVPSWWDFRAADGPRGFATRISPRRHREHEEGDVSPWSSCLRGEVTPTLTLPPRGGGNGRGASRRDAGVR